MCSPALLSFLVSAWKREEGGEGLHCCHWTPRPHLMEGQWETTTQSWPCYQELWLNPHHSGDHATRNFWRQLCTPNLMYTDFPWVPKLATGLLLKKPPHSLPSIPPQHWGHSGLEAGQKLLMHPQIHMAVPRLTLGPSHDMGNSLQDAFPA